MKSRVLFFLVLIALTTTLAQAQPVIRTTNGVLNASSYLPGVARGSWFVVFGTGLGPATISMQTSLPYPPVLSGTSVTFTPAGGGTPVSALMYYTLAAQVAGLLPSGTPAGVYNVTVTYNNQTSNAVSINVVDHNFGFATETSNGQGPAQATLGEYDLNRFTTGTVGQWSLQPAHPGAAMVLWGTGIGPDQASDITGGSSGDQTGSASVSVIVSGVAVTPAYAGRSTGSPGLDQINFTIPSNVTPSCFVSLQVSAGGNLSNLGSIAVAPAGQTACSVPTITEAQLHTLDTGGTLTVGLFELSHSDIVFTKTVTEDNDVVAGGFGKYAVDTVGSANFAMSQTGACYLLQRTGTDAEIAFGLPPQMTVDAGAQVTLNGPNASNISIPQLSDNIYGTILYDTGLLGSGAVGSPTLTQGTYTLTGTGGAGVGAFSASVTLPGDFVWTNESSISGTISQSAPLTVTWSGGATGLVNIAGEAWTRVSGGTSPNATYSAFGFLCNAAGSAGSFTIPAAMLQQLSAVGSNPLKTTFGTLSVIAVPNPSNFQGTFSAPLTAGGTTDLGFLGYGIAYIKIVGYN
ncbi:MAG: hypothetical protein ACLPWF_03770 [Bryobacteraceae bacterium]